MTLLLKWWETNSKIYAPLPLKAKWRFLCRTDGQYHCHHHPHHQHQFYCHITGSAITRQTADQSSALWLLYFFIYKKMSLKFVDVFRQDALHRHFLLMIPQRNARRRCNECLFEIVVGPFAACLSQQFLRLLINNLFRLLIKILC